MSKLKQPKINTSEFASLMTEMNEPFNWKLSREGDGLVKKSTDIKWLEWNEDGTFQSSHDEPGLGRSFILDPYLGSYTWMTTVVTEIIEQREDYIKFRTSNSVYELIIQN